MDQEDRETWPMYADYVESRREDNERILGLGHLGIKRFFTLDDQAYRDTGVIPVKYKELMGLAASMVLKCDGCIKYHIATSIRVGVSKEEIVEAFNIGLIIGGSIIIPHLRTATRFLEECLDIRKNKPDLLDF